MKKKKKTKKRKRNRANQNGFIVKEVDLEEVEEVEKCKIHDTPVDDWFYSKTIKGDICPDCIKAGYFIEKIAAEYEKQR